ncbi:hypothetical protein SHKM778_01770 [Streptomyces sp. KM77-8]|uniref:HTH tetR-type domain-containing protein n=1 Tax=Streptomyces haneummycinicus TaxID=3074435 RepID=A0AAT9H8V5_9ACTN
MPYAVNRHATPSLPHPDQLASTALAVIDRDGLAALSMRAVAKELGMSTMGLYRYVLDRGELERLVVELVLNAVDTELPDPGASWRERVEVLVRRLRDTVGAHPEVVPSPSPTGTTPSGCCAGRSPCSPSSPRRVSRASGGSSPCAAC